MVDDASRKGDLATEAPKGEVAPAAATKGGAGIAVALDTAAVAGAQNVASAPAVAATTGVAGSAAAAPAAKRKLAVAKSEPARIPAEERSKVVHIVRRLEEETRKSRALKRSPWLVGSVLVAIVLPTFLAALFYLFIASDRYVSEARFAVRNNEAPAFDALGMITGMPTSQAVSDSYIVADYVASRDMVKELERRMPFRAMYSNADFFSRLSPDATLEGLVGYWQNHVDVYFDSTKSTVTVMVQAFTAPDAERIAREVVEVVRTLVNDLSAQSRRDAVQFAASEVARAELRVQGARVDILNFRMSHNDLDPTQSAAATLGIAAGLETERSKLSSELTSLSGYLGEDAPSIQIMKSRIAALDVEIARIQGQVSSGTSLRGTTGAAATAKPGQSGDKPPDAALASLVGSYQELLVNQEFAEKAYTAAMASLDNARSEAARTQNYLAIFGQPSIADEATYPRRWLNIWIVLILASILWAIGMLATMTVRDHVR